VKRNSFILVFGFLLLFPRALVGSQAITVNQPITVSEARTLPHDSWVVVSGNIVGALPGGRNYSFRDPTGEIVVEINWNIWRGLNVGVSDRVEISGEVKVNRGLVSINARAITGTNSPNVRPGQALTLSHPVTVLGAWDLPNDSWVILTGNIVNSLGSNRYTFRDSSGEMIVEIDQNIWRGLFIGESDRVEIRGEVRVNRGLTTVAVRTIRGI